MAMQVDAGENVGRSDLFHVDPFQITVKENLRGRRYPPTPEQIIELAMSIYDEGQQQPIQCRRNADKRLISTAGFTRINAIRLIREGFEGTDGVFRQDEDFKVQVKVVDCNDETAFRHNIIENSHRNDTSDIDDAHNQQRLRENYGWTNKQIAELYRMSEVKVGQLSKLLLLTDDEQQLVHYGSLSMSAALSALEIDDPDKRADILIAAANENGKINGSLVNDAIRAHILNDDGAEETDTESSTESSSTTETSVKGAAGKKTKPLTLRNIRSFLEVLSESDDPAVKRFAADTTKWVNGKVTDKSMMNAVMRLLEASPTPAEELKKAA